jgi:hypothetical protein
MRPKIIARLGSAALLSLVAVAVSGGIVSGATDRPSGSVHSSGRHAFELPLPAGWRLSPRRLVDTLLMPREVLSAGTFPMPVGGGGNCDREPIAALRAMAPGDALITVQEYNVTERLRRHLTTNFPPKGERAGLSDLRFGRVAEAGPGQGVAATRATISFSEAGRAFDALVYFRGRPATELRQQVAQILAGLRFQPLSG